MQPTCEAGQLVRSYSIELENNLPSNTPANDVRRVFIENERQIRNQEDKDSAWRAYYEPWKPVEENP
jgi:phage anti-repressor protein